LRILAKGRAGDGAVPRQAPLSTVPAWALAAAGALAAAE
jgi:hypothetical protein